MDLYGFRPDPFGFHRKRGENKQTVFTFYKKRKGAQESNAPGEANAKASAKEDTVFSHPSNESIAQKSVKITNGQYQVFTIYSLEQPF